MRYSKNKIGTHGIIIKCIYTIPLNINLIVWNIEVGIKSIIFNPKLDIVPYDVQYIHIQYIYSYIYFRAMSGTKNLVGSDTLFVQK